MGGRYDSKIHIAVRIFSLIYFNFRNKGILYIYRAILVPISFCPQLTNLRLSEFFILLYFYITKPCLNKFKLERNSCLCEGENNMVRKQKCIKAVVHNFLTIYNQFHQQQPIVNVYFLKCTSTFLENQYSQFQKKNNNYQIFTNLLVTRSIAAEQRTQCGLGCSPQYLPWSCEMLDFHCIHLYMYLPPPFERTVFI